MALTHRVHIGPMAREIHDKLGTEPDIDYCWDVVREHIGKLIFGRSYVTVPFLTEADNFTQMSVFVKKKGFLDLMRRVPRYKVIGNLETLIDRDRSTWFPQYDFSPWDINDARSMYHDYLFRLTPNSHFDTSKVLEFFIRKPRVRLLQIPSEDVISLKLESIPGVREVYLINSVVFATRMHLFVKIGEQHNSIRFDRDVPFAFSYRKYKLSSYSILGREIKTDLRYNSREAHWKRSPGLLMPRAPIQEERKPTRKHRTALTITSHDADLLSRSSIITTLLSDPEDPGVPNRGGG